MKTIYRDAWKAIKEYIIKDGDMECMMEEEKFAEYCESLHNKIKDNYMKNIPEPHLDRHKLAAIIAVCASNEKVIQKKTEIEKGKLFLGRYLVALYAALSFMEDNLNKDIKDSGLLHLERKIGLCLPDPVICETKSVNAMARMMYWEERENTDDCIRVLELANTLFLIEQYTLLMYDVDIDSWAVYKRG